MAAVLLLLFGGAYLLAPTMAGWLVRFVPHSVDSTIGAAGWQTLAPDSARCTDPRAQAYVESITRPLLAGLAEQPFRFEFAVLDRDDINAFALPGGHIAVHFGLLQAAKSGDEVASVIAHEIGHVTGRHTTVRLLRGIGGRILWGLLFGWTGMDALMSHAWSLADLSYDRDQERDADEKGRKLLLSTGIDLGAMASFFERLPDGGPAMSLIASHPGSRERAEAARAAAVGQKPTLSLPAPPADLKCH